jgi:hypothetical protein
VVALAACDRDPEAQRWQDAVTRADAMSAADIPERLPERIDQVIVSSGRAAGSLRRKIPKSILGGCEQHEGECSPQRIGENDDAM